MKLTISDAWTELIGEIQWDHFCTFTFNRHVSIDFAHREMTSYYRRVESLGQAIRWAHTVEAGPTNGNTHVHAVISGTARYPTAVLRRRWKHGHTQIERFDPTRGWRQYLVKDVDALRSEFDASPRLRWRKPAEGSTVVAKFTQGCE
jgi:hypothetical protein